MSLSRRSWLSVVLGAVGALFSRRVVAGEKTGLPKVENFDPETDMVLIVHGATLPMPIVAPKRGPLIRQCTGEPPFWATAGELCCEAIHEEPGRAPHKFSVGMGMEIGTVDELVEAYRKRLTMSVRTAFWLDKPGKGLTGACQQNREAQAGYKLLRKKHDGAVLLNVITRDLPTLR